MQREEQGERKSCMRQVELKPEFLILCCVNNLDMVKFITWEIEAVES